MSKKHIRILSLVVIAIIITCIYSFGCSHNPRPPEAVNATWDPSLAYERSVNYSCTILYVEAADAVNYAETRKGKWITNWYLCKLKVLSQLRGIYKEPDVSFVYSDSWPTPESGIMIDKVPFPFKKGKYYVIGLDAQSNVLFMSERIAKILINGLNGWSALDGNTHFRIMQAVEGHYKFRSQILFLEGETKEEYIVSDGAGKLSVNKNSYSVSHVADKSP